MPASRASATLANAIRALAMDAVEQAAKSGHPGMPMGMADVATVLFTQFLKFDAAAPDWPDRDRFVLSAGHGSMLLYALLHLTGYPDMTMDELKRFRQLGARTAGHPEYGHAPASRPPPVRWARGSATRSAWRWPSAMLAARFGDDAGRSPHLGDRRRRLPDGGHQPRGDLARRPSAARPADRPVRRQQHHDRRRDHARRVRRPGRRFKARLGGDAVDGHDPAAIAAALARRAEQPTGRP